MEKSNISKVIQSFSIDYKNCQYLYLHRLYKDDVPVTQIISPNGSTKRQIGHLSESEIFIIIDLWDIF